MNDNITKVEAVEVIENELWQIECPNCTYPHDFDENNIDEINDVFRCDACNVKLQNDILVDFQC